MEKYLLGLLLGFAESLSANLQELDGLEVSKLKGK